MRTTVTGQLHSAAQSDAYGREAHEADGRSDAPQRLNRREKLPLARPKGLVRSADQADYKLRALKRPRPAL